MPEPPTSCRAPRWQDVGYPLPLRPHQHRALAAIEESWRSGSRRAWVVLPPGAGKTVVGLEAARRRRLPVVILSPNTAIQGQWVSQWRQFVPTGIPIGTDRGLGTPLTSLTYQSLATFDPESDPDDDPDGPAGDNGGDGGDGGDGGGRDRLLRRLHAGGAELVAALQRLGPVTLVLDECHHLLEVWGRLIAELLRLLPDATVIGLTATPPDALTPTEQELVEELFGHPLYATSIPALVRDGHLAPYAELAWLVRPTPAETDWLIGQATRFTQLQTDLMEPGRARTDFLTWLDRRFVSRDVGGEDAAIDWYRLERDEPGLAAAALRLSAAGLLALPPGAVLREEHGGRPTADDWAELIKDYVEHCLRPSTDDRDQELLARIRAALPGVGYQLTRRGIRRGRSPVDRVIARSAAKTDAAVEIVAAESAELGDRLRGLLLCDHERATATVPAGLHGVLDEASGSARLMLARLIADERTAGLAPLMITGRTVAGGSETIAAFAAFVADHLAGVELRPTVADDHDFVELQGSWSSRQWVRLATRFFESGHSRVLIGTRALLGEGWDAQRVNVLVDLTTATTATAVVQTRGRALRLDPLWPDKVAHTWSVVCVSEDHPGGTGDWDRFARKHRGYLGVTDSGEITVGVGHVDPGLSPYAPPPAAEFEGRNGAMLVRAQDRDRVRSLWRIGTPYRDQLVYAVRLRPERDTALPDRVEPGEPVAAPEHLPGGPPARRRSAALALPIVASVVAVALTMLLLATGRPWAPAVLLAAVAAWCWWLRRRRAADLAAGRLLASWAAGPDLIAYGRAVADGLRAAGRSERGAEAVRADVDAAGGYRITLDGASEEESAAFATALDELIGPVGTPRYLIPRYQPDPIGSEPAALRRAGARWLAGQQLDRATVTYHAVPAVFGANLTQLGHLMTGWHRWVSGGDPIRTATPEGTGILIGIRGSRPVRATSALRRIWR